MNDLIYRQKAIEALDKDIMGGLNYKSILGRLPSAEPERKKGERMSNREWVDFLSEQFNVSRTSAREMLHGLMKWKAEDNFKKQYSGGGNEKE